MDGLKIPVERNYKKNLVKTVAVLYNVHNELLGQVANLATSGEMREFNKDLTDKGLTISYEYDDFTNLTDENVQHLIELIELVKAKMKLLLQKTR